MRLNIFYHNNHENLCSINYRLRPLLRPHAAGNKDQQTCIQKSQNHKISDGVYTTTFTILFFT